MRHLREEGIGTGIHYPIPLHLQKAYVSLGYNQGDYPVAECVAAEILSLPMFPHLTDEQQAKTAHAVLSFASKFAEQPWNEKAVMVSAKNIV